MYEPKISRKDPLVRSYLNAKGEEFWRFRYRYYDSLGKRREANRQGFRTENQAYRKLLEIKTSIAHGNVKKVENSTLTVSEWLDIWYETYSPDWEESTRVQRENSIKYQMKPLLGHYRLSELTATTYRREFINELLNTHAPRTVNLHNKLFKTAINAAVEDEVLSRNRFNKVNVEYDRRTTNFLTPTELNKFLDTAKLKENITNYTLVLFLAYTGVRRGEALGLKWEHVNFKKKTVTIKQTRDNKGIRTPKTNTSYRTIKMDDKVVTKLKNYKKWCNKTLLNFGKLFKEDQFIFISYQTGSPITDGTVKYLFDRIIKQAKIKRITPHGLRHTHATILINEGVPVTTIAERLGNTPQMIYDTYAHPFKKMEEKSIQAFNNALNTNKDD